MALAGPKRNEYRPRDAAGIDERRPSQGWTAGHGRRDGLHCREHRAGDRLLLRFRGDCCHRWCRRAVDDSRGRRGRRSAGLRRGRIHQGGALGGKLHHLRRDLPGSEGRRRRGAAGRRGLHRGDSGGVHDVRWHGGADPRPLHVVAAALGAAEPRPDGRRDLADGAWSPTLDLARS